MNFLETAGRSLSNEMGGQRLLSQIIFDTQYGTPVN
jgi:hypothetical protein